MSMVRFPCVPFQKTSQYSYSLGHAAAWQWFIDFVFFQNTWWPGIGFFAGAKRQNTDIDGWTNHCITRVSFWCVTPNEMV